MTANPEPANAMTTPLVAAIPEPATVIAAGLTPAAAWSRRARRIGGFTQAAFAALWLARASLAIGGRAGDVLIAAAAIAVIGVFSYAIKVTAGLDPPLPRRWMGADRRPVILVATMSGSALAVTTGLAAGILLLGTAAAGFHDLAGPRLTAP